MSSTDDADPTRSDPTRADPSRPDRTPAHRGDRARPRPDGDTCGGRAGPTTARAATAARRPVEDRVAPEAVPIRIRDTGELIAAVPALLGHHPRDSLVLIATGGPSGRRIGLTLRIDLPAPRRTDPVVADVVGCLLRDRPANAVVIVLGGLESGGSESGGFGPGGSASPPRGRLVRLLTDALGRHGVPTTAAVWAESTAAGALWTCYGGCRCVGRLPDPASSVIAAAVVAQGLVIHPDRAALERTVAAADPDRIRRRERLLARDDAASGDIEPPAVAVAAGVAAVDSAVAAVAADRFVLDDATVVTLARALGDTRVRDTVLPRCAGPSATAVERLWTVLVRELPDPEAAEPAALLAVSAMLRGDGALTTVALDRAERAWPGHRLTRLLRVAADAGVRPDQLREWLLGAPGAGSGARS